MGFDCTKEELNLILEGLGMKRAMLETGTPFYSHDDAVRMDEGTRKKMGIRLASTDQLSESSKVLTLMHRLRREL